jgi:hypothetical protein
MGCPNSTHINGTLVPGRSRPQHQYRVTVVEFLDFCEALNVEPRSAIRRVAKAAKLAEAPTR